MGVHLQCSGLRLDEETFKDSPDYVEALIGFYNSFLTFWSRALKFSKRKWYQNMTLAIWSNYDAEFEVLNTNMRRYKDAVINCAGAVDRARSHVARKGMLLLQEWTTLTQSREERR